MHRGVENLHIASNRQPQNPSLKRYLIGHVFALGGVVQMTISRIYYSEPFA